MGTCIVTSKAALKSSVGSRKGSSYIVGLADDRVFPRRITRPSKVFESHRIAAPISSPPNMGPIRGHTVTHPLINQPVVGINPAVWIQLNPYAPSGIGREPIADPFSPAPAPSAYLRFPKKATSVNPLLDSRNACRN